MFLLIGTKRAFQYEILFCITCSAFDPWMIFYPPHLGTWLKTPLVQKWFWVSKNQKWRGLLNGACCFSFQDISYGGMFVHVCANACVSTDRRNTERLKNVELDERWKWRGKGRWRQNEGDTHTDRYYLSQE